MTPTELFHEACIHGNGTPISHINGDKRNYLLFGNSTQKTTFSHHILMLWGRMHIN